MPLPVRPAARRRRGAAPPPCSRAPGTSSSPRRSPTRSSTRGPRELRCALAHAGRPAAIDGARRRRRRRADGAGAGLRGHHATASRRSAAALARRQRRRAPAPAWSRSCRARRDRRGRGAAARGARAACSSRAGFDVVATAEDADDAGAQADRPPRPTWSSPTSACRPTHTDEGLRAAVAIRAAHPDVALLVLSQHVHVTYALELLGAGAAGRRLPAQAARDRTPSASAPTCATSARAGRCSTPRWSRRC